MANDRVWFVSARFEELRDLLFRRGYAIDPGARHPNMWDEVAHEEPPRGLVRIKAVRLIDPDDPDSEFDPQTSFSIEEYWSTEHVRDAYRKRGCFLAAYSYHGHAGDRDVRHDFDPQGHPEQPYHRHPPDAPERREPTEVVTPEVALDLFEEWLRNLRTSSLPASQAAGDTAGRTRQATRRRRT